MDDLITLRALGALLIYPNRELLDALPEIGQALARSRLLPPPERERLAALIDDLGGADPLALEERYVETFDRGRAASLHLFEHLHGDSRDRGPAMVDLKLTYESAGLQLEANELPDYLPVVLEYLSCRTLGEARATLADCAQVLRQIGQTLLQRGSPYAAVFSAALALAQQPGLDWSKASEAAPAEPSPDEDWAEAPAFGPAAAGAAGRPPETAVMQFVRRKPA